MTYCNIKQLVIPQIHKKTPFVVRSTDILRFMLASMLFVVVLTTGMCDNGGILRFHMKFHFTGFLHETAVKSTFETLKIALGEIRRLESPYLVVHGKRTGVNALVFVTKGLPAGIILTRCLKQVSGLGIAR